jgi:hypothetical protein
MTGLAAERITPEIVQAATAAFEVLEFFEPDCNLVIGAVIRDKSGFVHMHVDEDWRIGWDPYSTLRQVVDFFLERFGCLRSAVPAENRNMLSIMRKLGFVKTGEKDGVLLLLLTEQTRLSLKRSTRFASPT